MSPGSRRDHLLTADEVTELIDANFPQLHSGGKIIFVEATGPMSATVRMKLADRIIRPGGTISGPAMFTLADFSVYVAILAELGADALQAVTTNLNINFLTRPEPRDLIARVKLLRLGRRLAVGEVELHLADSDDIVAHAVATYALPPPPKPKGWGWR